MTETTQHYDAIIVGGGLVGYSLAVALAPLGWKIALLEAKAPPQSTSTAVLDQRAIALSYGSRQIFEAIGVWSHIGAQAHAIDHVHVSDRGHYGFSRIDAETEGLPSLGYVVPIMALGQSLQHALSALECDVLMPVVVKNIVTAADAVAKVSISQAGQEQTLSADWVFAADGAQSSVRQLFGIAAKTTDYQQSAIVTNVSLKRDHQRWAYERFTEEGPLALLPLGESHAAVVWTVATERVEALMALSDQDFVAALQKAFGYRLGKMLQLGQRGVFPLRLVRATQVRQDNVLLLGNAAHSLHPIAGQGFNLSLRDIATLVSMIAETDSVEEAVTHYLEQRQRDHRRTIALTDGLVKIFSNQDFPFTPTRGLALSALERMPYAKSALNRVMMGMAGRMSRLERGLPI